MFDKNKAILALECLSKNYDSALGEAILLLTFVVDAGERKTPDKPIRIEAIPYDMSMGLRRRYRVIVEEITDDSPLVNIRKRGSKEEEK